MRAVAQRVNAARVEVGGEEVGAIGRGLLVYLGVAPEDDAASVATMVSKLAGLRIFEDAQGKMSLSVESTGGEILVVPQFTLFGDVRRGRRPSFDGAAPPELARGLCAAVVSGLRGRGHTVATGRFRAPMQVHSEVAGPVTILIDTTKVF
jgi:D-tyrosyl-tRNA(Tyr) deacylase